jgi:hypothetical protein
MLVLPRNIDRPWTPGLSPTGGESAIASAPK